MRLDEARLFVAQFVAGEYSPEEYRVFLQWLEGASIDELEVIANEHERLAERWHISETGPSAEWIEQLEQKLDRLDKRTELAPVIPMGKRQMIGRRWWVAASVLVILAGGATWLIRQEDKKAEEGFNQSIAALSNVITTPKGQVKQTVLPDGSRIWLNAGSTIGYSATAFAKERAVELSGEAFFEVASNPNLPFRVKIRQGEVLVLGTRFNVMSYEDEQVSQVTLVDGAVKMINQSGSRTLQPGEQAAVDLSAGKADIKLIQGVNLERVVAWKDGSLEFDSTELHTVMKAISRTYDIEIQYEGIIPERYFSGGFQRSYDMRTIVAILNSQHIHCKINGRTITVTP